MLRRYLHRLIEICALQDVKARDLFLGLREGTVRNDDLATPDAERRASCTRASSWPCTRTPRSSISLTQACASGPILAASSPGSSSSIASSTHTSIMYRIKFLAFVSIGFQQPLGKPI